MADTQNVVEKLYNRADIVNFMGLTVDATTYKRMTGFTDNGKSLNTETYERRYVDEKSSRKDVTGYATEIAYGFDRYTNNDVHDLIANVHDLEQTGVVVPIVAVNFNKKELQMIHLKQEEGIIRYYQTAMAMVQMLISIVVHLVLMAI